MRIKLMSAVAKNKDLTKTVVNASFRSTKMWPMEFSFLDLAHQYHEFEADVDGLIDPRLIRDLHVRDPIYGPSALNRSSKTFS